MSNSTNNEYINRNIYPLSTSKTEIILSLISEISNLEEKITQTQNSLNEGKNSELKTEIENIKQNKSKINKEINSLSTNLLLDISNKDSSIKKKEYSIKEITKKINNYKNILFAYDNLTFNSPILKKYLMTNNYNQFLTDEQIDDILSKTQNLTKKENLIQKTEKEYQLKREELKEAKNERKKVLNKINEIKENLKMLKEEKIIINNELVNYISLKETLESIIKSNLTNLISIFNTNDNTTEIDLKNDMFVNNKEKYSRNRINTSINNIKENNNNNNNDIIDLNHISKIFEFENMNKKIWEEIISLNKYEIYNLDANKISNEICNDIFDLINFKMNSQYIQNNMGKSISIEKEKGIQILLKGKSQNFNDRYKCFNHQSLSCDYSPMIKRTKSNIVAFNNSILVEFKEEIKIKIKNEIKNLLNQINENKISAKYFTEVLSNVIINILSEKGYKLNEQNIHIYLSFILKKAFYENQISSKIKFINKDYKNIKKFKKRIYDKLQDQLTKLNSNIESINNTIILQENKLKVLNNNIGIEKKKVGKNENININGNIILSLDEQNYIQLCRKANSFINEKNEIEKEIEIIENEKKLQKYQGEIKIKNMNNEINELDKQIFSKEKELSDNKNILEEKISQLTKTMDYKYNMVREKLISYKKECSNIDKQNEYNEFIDKINDNINNEYYKTLFNLEKFYIRNTNFEANKTIDNFNINENILKTYKSYNINTYRKNAKNIKTFSPGNDFFSPINIKRKDNLYNQNNKILKDTIESSNQKNIYQNKIKNNYINICDSYNNLNNYFFQFQTPSTMISFDKQNNTNNVINQIKNQNEINNASNTSPFSSSLKFSSSKKKNFSPSITSDIKPKNLMNNLRYLSTDNKYMKNKIKNNNYNDFKICLSSKENKFISRFSRNKKKPESKINFFKGSRANIELDKTNISNKRIYCYFRVIKKNQKYIIYNPLMENSSISNICQSPFNFIKSKIYIDNFGNHLKLFPSNQLDPIVIKSENIDNYRIPSFMNQIIEIVQNYKIFKKNNDNINDINIYIKKLREEKSYKNLSEEEIKKCCLNQEFSFELILKKELIIEFLFTCYEEYKAVSDDIKNLIKDKKETLYKLFHIKKFEYPNSF